MIAINYAAIAKRLNPAQRAVINALGWEPVSLGCSEPTAARLAKIVTSRPPLTARHGGGPSLAFSLTDHGMQVKAVLPSTPADTGAGQGEGA